MKRSFKSIWFILGFALKDLFPIRLVDLFPIRMLSGGTAEDEGKIKRVKEWIKRVASSMLASLPALLNIFVISLMVITGIVIGGLVIGAEKAMNTIEKDNPHVRSLEVYVNPNTKIRTIDQGVISKLGSLGLVNGKIQLIESKDVKEKESMVEGAYGWEYVSLWFFMADRGQDSDYTMGRTISVGDPILEKLTFIDGEKRFLTNQEEEIVITKALLKRLGYQDKIPKEITVFYKEKPESISIVGVVEEILPAIEFIIPEGFWQIYRDHLWNPDPKYGHAYIGPLTPDESAQVITAINGYLKGIGISYHLVERIGSDKWLKMSLSKEDEWVKSYWQGHFLKALYGYINDQLPSSKLHLDFDYPVEDPEDSFLPLPKRRYLNATVYLTELESLEPLAEFIKGDIGLEPDQRVIGALKWYQQIKNFGRGILVGVVSVLALICAANIYLTFTQAIQRKIPEIGIFMALGASRVMVRAIYLTESIIIWMTASILGWSISNKSGHFVATLLKSNFHFREDLVFFQTPLYLILGVTIVALLICTLATLLASTLAVRIQPAKAVRHE